MYQKLLLNCDGGIIDAAQQAEQDNCAMVAIGLGGTGVDCLKNLKTKVYNRIKADDPDSAVPSYANFKFLAVDTDRTGMEESNAKSPDISKINMDTEFFDISYRGDIVAALKMQRSSLARDPVYKEWLEYDKIDVLSARAGAGGVRQLGRYLLIEKSQAFLSKVSGLINEALRNLINPKVYIHIFSGISGGTGAGTLLDVCYLVRHALSRQGVNAFVFGYVFLPDVNLSKNLTGPVVSYIKMNGYAAMQELDYCMNFQNNGDKWSQRYKGDVGLIENKYPPVDLCHLITAKTSDGNSVTGEYERAMHVVTDYIMDFSSQTSSAFSMESHIANYNIIRQQINKERGALYEYCIIGAANATLPFKEVLTYLTAEMFDSFKKQKSQLPSKSEFETFARENGLRFDPMYSQLTAGCDMSFPIPDVKWKDALGNDDLTTTWFADQRARVENALDKNFSALSRDLESYSAAADTAAHVIRSTISKIFSSLRTVMIDPDRGPFYAASLLRSTTGSDLIALIDGHLAEAKSKYGQESVQGERLLNARDQAQRDFFENARKLTVNGAHKYAVYRDSTRLLIIHYTRLVIFAKMETYLEKLREQLTNLAGSFTDVYSSTMNRLIETFDANREYLKGVKPSTTAFEYPLADIDDLKDALDQTIKGIDMSSSLRNFTNYMLTPSGIAAWTSLNENEITREVKHYFTSLFANYSNKTMSSYLQDKYGTTNHTQLVSAIRDDIMYNLDMNASPLFWTSPVYNIDSAAKLGYITVPNTCTEVSAAATNLTLAKPELGVRQTDVRDRITIMRCLVGTPLFGYQGLLQYEQSSVGAPSVGKHIYEGQKYIDDKGAEVEGRNWNYLPSPHAYSIMTDANSPILRDNARTAAEMYELAEQNKVIHQSGPNEFCIRTVDPAHIERMRLIFEEAQGLSNAEKIDAQDRLKAMKSAMAYEPSVTELENDGANGLPDLNKRDVRIDHFAAAPMHQAIVVKQLELIAQADAWIDALEIKTDTTLNNFLEELFAGTITFKRPLINFKDEFGMETVLSSPDMPRGAVPLYQALLNYRELDSDLSEALRKQCQATLKISPLPDAAFDACRAIERELKDAKLMLEDFAEIYPRELKDARELLSRTKEALARFTRRYGIDMN